jgi:hypothetical protein
VFLGLFGGVCGSLFAFPSVHAAMERLGASDNVRVGELASAVALSAARTTTKRDGARPSDLPEIVDIVVEGFKVDKVLGAVSECGGERERRLARHAKVRMR